MIRVLLIVVVPMILPTAVFILWRTFAPTSWGGSEAIAHDQWEPLPWKWLLIGGGVLVLLSVATTILFPEIFGGIG